jgi:hypothetical protein
MCECKFTVLTALAGQLDPHASQLPLKADGKAA